MALTLVIIIIEEVKKKHKNVVPVLPYFYFWTVMRRLSMATAP